MNMIKKFAEKYSTKKVKDTAPSIPTSRIYEVIPEAAPKTTTTLTDTDATVEEGPKISERLENWMREDLDALERSWSIFRSHPDDGTAKQNLFVASHNIRGVATSYGYPAVANVCGALSQLVSGDTDPDMYLLERHIVACRAAYQTIKSTN